MATECDCGRFYDSPAGVQLCQDNDHGSGKDVVMQKFSFRHTLEPEFTVVCARCNVPVKAYIRMIEGMCFEVNILPHVCQIEEPIQEDVNE